MPVDFSRLWLRELALGMEQQPFIIGGQLQMPPPEMPPFPPAPPRRRVRLDPPEDCPNCGALLSFEEDFRNNRTQCFDCFGIFCHLCGDRLSDDTTPHTDGHSYCSDHVPMLLPIQPWNARMSTTLLSDDTGPTYGWELEVVVPDANLLATDKILHRLAGSDGIISLKQDNSTTRGLDESMDGIYRPRGFEIVTRPFHWSWWNRHKLRFYDTFGALIQEKMVSHMAGTCGLHVHVGNIPARTRALLLYFVFSNPELCLAVSRRQYTSYCCFPELNWVNCQRYVRSDAAGALNRYSAIHYSTHNTVEFRFFRGTLNPRSFQASLEFTKALVDLFSEEGRNHETTSDEVLNYMVANEAMYPDLVPYLRKRKLA